MRKNLFAILLSLSAVLMFNNPASAQGKLIHYWNFNTYYLVQYTDTIHGIKADYSTIDVNKAQILYAKEAGTSAVYRTYIDSINVQPTDYDTINARFGAIDGLAMRVRNPSDSMKLMFYIPTTNYRNIKLTYASQSSSVTKGQLHQVFDYSVDSGMTWRTAGLSIPSDSAWLVYNRTTVTFTTDTQVNDNAKLVFRITFNGNDTGVKGNNRFDNVTVEGDTVIHVVVNSVNNVSLNEAAYTLYPNPVENKLNISSSVNDVAEVTIYNVAGKEIKNFNIANKHAEIDVADLISGIYFISIKDPKSGDVKRLKFVKL